MFQCLSCLSSSIADVYLFVHKNDFKTAAKTVWPPDDTNFADLMREVDLVCSNMIFCETIYSQHPGYFYSKVI